MNIQEAIQTRRSIPIVKEDDVPKELIEQIITAGTYAPNHFRTEPWRFFVLEGESRSRLGDVFANITKEEQADPKSLEAQQKITRSKNNPLRSPVVIAVGVEPSNKNRVIEHEEFAATHAAVQNMLLTAHSLGLGAVWRTGAICYHPEVTNFFNLSNNGGIIAFIYLGYPDIEPKPIERTDAKQFTTWMN